MIENNGRERKRDSRSTNLVYIALSAVLIAVCSWISIPAAVPFTLQTFAIFFVLLALGGKNGTVAIVVYILLGAAGIPVFAQFSAGIGTLLGTTGGFLVGFVCTGLAYWLLIGLLGEKQWVKILALLLGLVLLYAFGTVWYMLLYARTHAAISVATALAWCVLPFVVPDLIKLGLALLLVRRLAPVLRLR